ncbi:hypothetical protein KAR91_52390 [Candidatus Pacearchaeota archaeon]|nr:hypothetical protein [Candidatus Pacearchaeota archaeon]
MKSTQRSVERAHRLFQLLKKLEMFHVDGRYDSVDDIYSAWAYIKRQQQKEVENDAKQ